MFSRLTRRVPRRTIGVAGLLGAAALAVGVVLALGLGGSDASAASPAASHAAPRVSTSGFPSGPGQPGIFTERCGFSHEAADDPILMPGRPAEAMHHDFFGNVTTGASSTAASLRGRATTCATSADSSAYWTPVLYQHGRALTPLRSLLYWLRPRRMRGDTVHDIPPGLQMIAGDESATHPQGVHTIAWSCTSPRNARAARHATPVSCPGGEHVRLIVTFPSCWDGHTLSADHTANVVDPVSPRRGCPSSHPVLLPRIVLHIVYPTSSAAGLALSMSPTMTGSTDTAHADFIDGWRPSVLDRDIGACVATSTKCGPVRGPQATPMGPISRRRRGLAG